MLMAVRDAHVAVRLQPLADGDYLAVSGPRRETVRVAQDGEMLYVHNRDGMYALRAIPYLTYISASAETSGELRAPMMGMITKVNVAAGDRIKTGDIAAVLESMKMELRIAS